MKENEIVVNLIKGKFNANKKNKIETCCKKKLDRIQLLVKKDASDSMSGPVLAVVRYAAKSLGMI